MPSGTIWAIVAIACIFTLIFSFLAIALQGVAERWAILGVIASVLGIVVGIAIAIIQHPNAINSQPSASSQSASPPSTPSPPQSGQTEAAPSPGVTSLPASSPLRKQILGMDQVCGELGLSQHAWLPGQSSPTDLSGRVILAPDAAYTWSCTENGPKLTRDDMTRGCQIWYPGTKAYTLDPNDAYSWVCI
jgi:hypothetical protein